LATGEDFGRAAVIEDRSESVVEFMFDSREFGAAVPVQARALREVLPQRAVGVFVGTALPGTGRIAEVERGQAVF
jgi:hypothetical protein